MQYTNTYQPQGYRYQPYQPLQQSSPPVQPMALAMPQQPPMQQPIPQWQPPAEQPAQSPQPPQEAPKMTDSNEALAQAIHRMCDLAEALYSDYRKEDQKIWTSDR